MVPITYFTHNIVRQPEKLSYKFQGASSLELLVNWITSNYNLLSNQLQYFVQIHKDLPHIAIYSLYA